MTRVAFSPSGKVLAAVQGKTVRLWDISTGKGLADHKVSGDDVHAIAFCPASGLLATGLSDGTIRFWDARSGSEEGEPIRLAGKSSNCVAVSPDGSALAANTAPRSDEPGWGDRSPGIVTPCPSWSARSWRTR